MNIIDIKSKDSLSMSVQLLQSGGIVIFPTDTVYGIGCSLNETAISKLYKVKNRPLNQPTAVLMSKNIFKDLLIKNINLPAEIQQDFDSGRTTIILPANWFDEDFPKIIIAEDETIGVRLPRHQWLEKLIDSVGPIVATSANKKSGPVPTNFSELSSQIIDEADLTIKSDKAGLGQPSAIYHLVLKKLLR